VGIAFFQNGQQEHASVLYYVWSVVVGVLWTVVTISAMYASSRASTRLVRPRPRWLYGLLGVAWCAPVVAFVRVAVEHVHAHTQNETSWAAVAGGILAMYCGSYGLLMLGRALWRGQARRAFWLFPPQWADHQYPPPSAIPEHPARGR
jgi:hypothetical protein